MMLFLNYGGDWEFAKGPCVMPFRSFSIMDTGTHFVLTTDEGTAFVLHREGNGLSSNGIWNVHYDFEEQMLVVDILGLEYRYKRKG